MPRIRILILEDNPSDAELTLHQIRRELTEFDYDLAKDRDSFVILLQKSPNIILADYALPQFTALDAMKMIQDQKLDIPLIIVSGTIGEEVAVEAMRMGATDYLLKDRLGRLNQAMLRALDEAETRRARRKAEDALKESELRYRSLFQDSPVALWEEDFSGMKTELDRLSQMGVTDLYAHFVNDRQAFQALTTRRKVLAVNRSTLALYQGENHPGAVEELSATFSDESVGHFLEELMCFYSGKQHFSRESIHQTLKGEKISVNIKASIAPGHADTWAKVYTTVIDITARKRAEDATLQSERLLRSVIDSSPDWIFAKDRGHRYVIANQTFADDLELSIEDVLGKTDAELGFTSVAIQGQESLVNDGFIGTDQAVFETGEAVYSYDAWITHRSGRQWVFDSIKVPLRDHAGEIWAVLGSARDISDRLQNERALRESEELLSKVMEANPNAIYILDSTGKYCMLNQAAADMFGLAKEDILGSTNLEISKKGNLLEREAVLFAKNSETVIRTGQSRYIPDESFTRSDGVIHWFQTRLIPIRQRGQEPLMLGVSTDITDRKYAADALQRLNETLELRVEERTAALEATTRDLAFVKDQLETILQNSPDGFLLLDKQGKIVQANIGYLKMTGCLAADVLTRDFSELLVHLNASVSEQFYTQALREKRQVHFEVRLQPPNLAAFDCNIAIIPVYENEMLTATVINLHDVSEAKEVQRMKDAFVSNVSHELRTPITNFICNLELIRIRPDNTNIYLSRLERETEHLRNLIEDLLHLSRLDQGAIGIGKTYFDLNDLSRNYAEMREPLAEARELTLAFISSDEPCRVYADEGLISQVISILLTNAINYTPQGGTVTIKTMITKNGEQMEAGFAVIDNGPGISLEDQKRIKQRFYRGSVGLDSGVSGTGLGLSIAEEILVQHDGRLEIISDGIAGHGTTFIAWLPQNGD